MDIEHRRDEVSDIGRYTYRIFWIRAHHDLEYRVFDSPLIAYIDEHGVTTNTWSVSGSIWPGFRCGFVGNNFPGFT